MRRPTDLLSLVVIKLSINVKDTEAWNATFLDCAREREVTYHTI